MRLRYCRTSHRGEPNQTYAWFDTDAGRQLSDAEIDALLGHEERWVARYADGSERTSVAVFSARGFLNEYDIASQARNAREGTGVGVYPKTTSFKAVKHVLTNQRVGVVSFRGPNGEAPDIVRVQFVSGDVVTTVNRVFVRDDLVDACETYGAKAPCSESIGGWTFGFGALRHVENVRRAAGIKEYYDIPYEDHERASHTAARANLAIFRALKMLTFETPLWRLEWAMAAVDTGADVDVQINDEPWTRVDEKGRRVDAVNSAVPPSVSRP